MIIAECKSKDVKSIEDVLVGDIFLRKSDNAFYRLNSISWGDTKGEDIYMFEGFSILGRNNLRKHFRSEENKLVIYGE